MFIKKSGRFNPNFSASQNHFPNNQYSTHLPFRGVSQYNQQQYQQELQEQELKQQRYFNSPQIQELKEIEDFSGFQKSLKDNKESIEKKETFDNKASATSKALTQLEMEGGEKKKWKKTAKIPMAAKRKKLNQRLSRLLTPKSALILLHELKPGCVYKVQEQTGSVPPSFFAEVDFDGQILGSGIGSSKAHAKNLAAESAIKMIVSRTMSRCSEIKEGEAEAEEKEEEDSPENLPWAGLASFAIYKMFSEWQNQGTDVLPMTRPTIRKKMSFVNAPTKKELPSNANELHPAVVLNMVNPGLTAIEVEREDSPKCRVKMAYVIEGKTYSGVGGNKKDAKKEAAKAVLEGLYGLSYG